MVRNAGLLGQTLKRNIHEKYNDIRDRVLSTINKLQNCAAEDRNGLIGEARDILSHEITYRIEYPSGDTNSFDIELAESESNISIGNESDVNVVITELQKYLGKTHETFSKIRGVIKKQCAERVQKASITKEGATKKS